MEYFEQSELIRQIIQFKISFVIIMINTHLLSSLNCIVIMFAGSVNRLNYYLNNKL